MEKSLSPRSSKPVFSNDLSLKVGTLPERERVLITSWLLQKSEHTRVAYRRALRDFFFLFPTLHLQGIEVGHLVLFLKSKEQLKPATLKFYRDALSSLLTFCEKSGYLERNPSLALDPIRVSQNIGSKVLTREEFARLLEVEENPRNRFLMKLLYFSGLRISEALSLTMGHFQERTDGFQLVITGKGGKVRSVFIGEEIFQEAQDLISDPDCPKSRPLFCKTGNTTEPISSVAAWKIVKQAAKKAKISKAVSPHWFRHTSATHAIENGAPIHVVQHTLGHSSLTTTGKYLEAFPKESNFNYLGDAKKISKDPK